MAQRTVSVRLTAQVQGYIDGMQKAAQATREAGSETEKLAQQQAAFEEMGRASMVAGGAIAAGLALSTKAAIDWDTAWAGVTKTVDGSPQQLAEVEQGLRDLSGVLPASHAEIAAVAEAAGQLGVQTPNVVAFTKTMIDLGETTNLTSEQAATSLARFTNIMGTSQDKVSNLGSALVDLGNNYATTEAEILEMAMRLAGAGKQIGMSEGQVLGLSTALSSVGVEAEAGGSAMSKVMIDIASSVEKGGDRLQQFAQVAGMSADEFAAKWRSDPGAALSAFVKGLANAEAQGKSTFGVLEELGITETRMRDALLRSSSAADQFAGAMQQGNKAFEENAALTAEADKRYETTAAKLGMMRNKVVDAAISLGEHLLPAIEAGADGIGSFADLLDGLDGPMGAVVAWGGLIAGGILLTGGVAMAAVPKIAAYKVAMETLGITGAGVRGKLGSVASFMTGPWGLALTAATISVQLFNNVMDGSKSSAQELENAIKQGAGAFDTMSSKAAENEAGITKAFVNVSQHFENLPALADKAASAGRGFWSSMSFNENAALDSIKELGNSLTTLAATDLPRAQDAFKSFVKDSGLNDTQALTLMNEEMAGFKSALIDAAEASGVATDDATLLKFAMGEVGAAAKEGADGTGKQSDALDDLDAKAQETQEAIKSLADEIRGFGSDVFDMRDANRSLESSYEKLNSLLQENGNNFDITTSAGRDTQAALDDVAEATNRSAAATFQATGDQGQMNAKLAEGRNKLIDMLTPYYGTRDAAAAYVDKLNLISPQKVTEMIAKTDAATNAVNIYKGLLDSVNGSVSTVFNVIKQVSKVGENADGGMYAYADGGIAAYASGGFATGIYKGGAPIHKFAEPETGWEAYISGKPSERDRNRQIWQETGKRLGVDGGSQATVYVPTSVTVKDADGRLIGTMGVIADAKIDGFAAEQARQNRRAGA